MGHGVVRDLAAKGWKVIVFDWNEDAGSKVAEEIGGDFFKVDVRSWEDQFQAFEKVYERYSRLDFGKFAEAVSWAWVVLG